MKFVGGPIDGADMETRGYIVLVEGYHGRYIRWWDMPADYDRWWFEKGLPEPAKPERYMLWQEVGHYEDHPSVVDIRDALR